MPDRFSADEARAIFERAARRQHVAAAPDGLTVDELMAIGAEAGLDPALVAAEAAAARLGPETPPSTWHGVPVGHRRSRLLPAQLSDAEWARAVDALRAEFKTSGTSEQIGTRREWASAPHGAGVRVTVERRLEGDVVAIEQTDQSKLAGGLLGGIFGAMGLALSVSLAVIEPVAIPVGLLFCALGALSYAGFFLGARSSAVRTPARFDRVLDRIDLISRVQPPRPLTPSERIGQGRQDSVRIDPGLLDGAAPDAGAAARRSRVR